ncbi:MAG: hypothetical protein V3T86_17425 [Planctomycetota bacterium]
MSAALGEMPAYLRRARRVERCIDRLFEQAKNMHEEMGRFVIFRRRQLDEATSPSERRRAEERLEGASARFQKRFTRWLNEEAPLAAANAEIDGYNRWFEFERECSLKDVPLGSLPFERREPITVADLLARYPLHS